LLHVAGEVDGRRRAAAASYMRKPDNQHGCFACHHRGTASPASSIWLPSSLASFVPDGVADLSGLKDALSEIFPEFSVCLALNPCLPNNFDLLMSDAAAAAFCGQWLLATQSRCRLLCPPLPACPQSSQDCLISLVLTGVPCALPPFPLCTWASSEWASRFQ
jgi:hypothetical protein